MPEFSSAPTGPRDLPGEGNASPAAGTPYVYLGRQPILDRAGKLSAYELLFRSSGENRAVITDDALATAQVMTRAIGQIGLSTALGEHSGYVNIGRELLFDDIVYLLPTARFVLEVLEHVEFDAQVCRRLAALRASGFRIALDDVTEHTAGLAERLNYVDIVKIDLVQVNQAALPRLAVAAARAGKTLIAEKVETREDFELARTLGFDLFQGYFFARPQVLSTRRARSSKLALLRLLALVGGEVSIAELEMELRGHPDVVVQLLRLVNSSAFGLDRPIASLRAAVLAVGTRQIARWAQLLLYASGDLPWNSDPLVQLAGTRSHFLELAAQRLRPGNPGFADAAFMTGLFSLAPALIGATPSSMLGELGLAPAITEAVDGYHGPLGMLLRVALAIESGDADGARALIEAHGGEFAVLTPELLAELNLTASSWFVMQGLAGVLGSGTDNGTGSPNPAKPDNGGAQ